MSNLSELLNIADKNAFSNLYDVEIGSSETSKDLFKLRVESVQVDGYSLDYKMNESTKQYMVSKVNRPRSIQLSIRESNTYQFLRYLNEWLINFYNPKNNVFIAGENSKGDIFTGRGTLPEGSNGKQVVRKRPIKITSWGNNPDKSTPDLSITVANAMIEKCPSLSLAWADSKPIVYQVSFVCEYIDYTFGSTSLETLGMYK